MRLRDLSLFRCNKFKNVGLQHIASLPSLTKLSLRYFLWDLRRWCKVSGQCEVLKGLQLDWLQQDHRYWSETLITLDFSHNVFFVFLF